MLVPNAESNIKKWVENAIESGTIMLDIFLSKDGTLKHIECAQNEVTNANCYWNVYHNTITISSYDDKLFQQLNEFRDRVRNNTPPGI